MPRNSPRFKNDLSSLFSKPFEIKAKSGKCFFVHSDILEAGLSLPRGKTMEVWKKTTGGRVDLSRWDDNTVERFVQFLYVGDYKFPGLVEEKEEGEDGGEEENKEEEEEEEEDDEEEEEEEEGYCGEEGEERGGEVMGDGGVEPHKIQGPMSQKDIRALDMNFLWVHSKIYMLARYIRAKRLKAMAFKRFEVAITDIRRRGLMAVDLIRILRYVHPGTNPGEPIRTLVTALAVESIEGLLAKDEMALLLRGEGDLGLELMKGVVKRLYGMKDKAFGMETRIWLLEKQAASMSKEKQAAEIASAARLQELQEKIRKLELSNTKMVQELKAVQCLETPKKKKVHELGAANKEVLGPGIITVAETRLLKEASEELPRPTDRVAQAVGES